MAEDGVFPLEGVIQHYAWGGYDLLPTLLGQHNVDHIPWAEWWLGTHPKGPSRIQVGEEWMALHEMISSNPAKFVGPVVADRFGPRLPFLFKVLDVRSMLSIQLHPTIPSAEAGFALEEAAGIPRLAPHRNYKDRNHKPEFMLALTDFWLLHGFRKAEEIANSLSRISAWSKLRTMLEEGGLQALYEYVMNLPVEQINVLLQPLFEELKQTPPTDPAEPDYWAWLAFQEYTDAGNFDRGIFSIYWLNLVFLEKGQGIFQGAGIPHAYLRGANIELMANSDNVLRGGLTPKHIDVPELLANIVFDPVTPQIQGGTAMTTGILDFPMPVPDFALSAVQLAPNESIALRQEGPGIYMVYEGIVSCAGQSFKRGQAFYVLPGIAIEIQASNSGPSRLFRATTGLA